MLVLILSLLIAFLVFTLGYAVYVSGRDKTTKYFGFFAFLVSLWVAFNASGSSDIVSIDLRVVFTRIDYVLGVLMAGAFLLFSAAISKKKKMLSFARLFIMPGVFLVAIATALNSVIAVNNEGDVITTSEKVLFTPYIAIVLCSAILGIFLLAKTYVTSVAQEKQKLKYIVIGLSVAVVSTALLNVVLPLVVSDKQSQLLGAAASYVSVLIFTVFTWIGMTKHKLFDVRASVSNALAYAATVLSVLGLYLLLVFSLSGTDVLGENLSTLQRVAFASIAIVSGMFFQPAKRFFNRLTNKLFYRDAYDGQALLDELNKTLVNTVDLEALLTKTSLIIQENLKTTYATFYIRETSYFDSRIIGAHRKHPEIEDIEKIADTSKHIKRKVHSVAHFDKKPQDIEMNNLLTKNEFEVVARLVSTLDYEVEGIGFLFVGHKRSGSQYTKQDLQILEIIANELVIAVENILRFEEIEQFNVTLQKKIDDATKELKESNEKLRALDEAKDEFVSMASHQLRTPLTSIKGYISMVLEGDAGKVSETQKTMLGQAFFSSQRMVYLISDLLNVSRLKTGKFLIETKPVYLPDLVADEIDQLQEGAKAKDLTLSFVKPKNFPTLTLDDMKIRQVVMNFTDNAIYYTPSGGKITIELKDTKDSVEFTVKDSGIGVPKEQQHKLFAKFYRADNARKARPDGTGLGLFMAKKVIIAQGGSIIFKSTEGKGSTFGFSFPKAKLLVKAEE